MRVLIQRVKKASVEVNGNEISRIGKGLLVFLGVEEGDGFLDVNWLIQKIVFLRIFNDQDKKMNLNLMDVSGDVLVVSQFTLHASTKKGNRPSFIRAARPDVATPLYELFINELSFLIKKKVETGQFGAMMDVHILNDGPITIFMDSKNRE